MRAFLALSFVLAGCAGSSEVPNTSPPIESDTASEIGPELQANPEVEILQNLSAALLPTLGWTTDCTVGGSSEVVSLSPESGEGASLPPLVEGGPTFVYLPPDDSDRGASRMRLTVDLSLVASFALDDQGREALAVDTSCFLGNGFSNAIEVWGHTAEGSIAQLPSPLRYSKFDGYIINLEGDADALIVTMRAGEPGDDFAHLNGYPFVRVTEHRFDGTAWVMTERSMVRAENA
jgi:hypothetical protein